MTAFYGMRRLARPEDWQGLTGADNWVEEHSAFELAYAWQQAGGFPRDVREAFESSGIAALSGLTLETAIVEKPVFLDTLVGPSMNDLMAYARNRSRERIVIAVEGKARETFGEPVAAWVRGDAKLAPGARPKPTRVRRLEFYLSSWGSTSARTVRCGTSFFTAQLRPFWKVRCTTPLLWLFSYTLSLHQHQAIRTGAIMRRSWRRFVLACHRRGALADPRSERNPQAFRCIFCGFRVRLSV